MNDIFSNKLHYNDILPSFAILINWKLFSRLNSISIVLFPPENLVFREEINITISETCVRRNDRTMAGNSGDICFDDHFIIAN